MASSVSRFIEKTRPLCWRQVLDKGLSTSDIGSPVQHQYLVGEVRLFMITLHLTPSRRLIRNFYTMLYFENVTCIRLHLFAGFTFKLKSHGQRCLAYAVIDLPCKRLIDHAGNASIWSLLLQPSCQSAWARFPAASRGTAFIHSEQGSDPSFSKFSVT